MRESEEIEEVREEEVEKGDGEMVGGWVSE